MRLKHQTSEKSETGRGKRPDSDPPAWKAPQQDAEKRIGGRKKCQGTTLQDAEKRIGGRKECQGTTSVVP
jgi:hypothetical protein